MFDFNPTWMDSLRTPRDIQAGDQYVAGVTEWLTSTSPESAAEAQRYLLMAVDMREAIFSGRYDADLWLRRAMEMPESLWRAIVVDLAGLLAMRGLSADDARRLQRGMGNRCLAEALHAGHPDSVITIPGKAIAIPVMPGMCPACIVAAVTVYAWTLAITLVTPERLRTLAHKAGERASSDTE